MRMPKIKQARTNNSFGAPRIKRSGGGRTAFGAGGDRAFRDPQTMTAPDQAFGTAMAMPQGTSSSIGGPPTQ